MGESMSRKKGLGLTVLCSAMIALASFGPAILKSGGFFTLVSDFNYQQIPFSAAAWEGIHSGSSWLWGIDLGSSLVNSFSFYNLGSPFFWITLLFSKDSFPWMAGFLFVLKYMTAAGTSYDYLRRFCGHSAAMMGALVYAFSGYQATNLMFNHFHDVVAFFPLLLSGVEDMLRAQKKTRLIAAVFINCLVNYFFFLQEVIFLMIYFLFRTWKRYSFRQIAKIAVECLLSGVWGICMAAILFLPSVIYILGSQRNTAFSESLFYPLVEIIHIMKGILLPGDTMDRLTALYPYAFGSTACFLPLFGAAFAVAYVLRTRNWLGKLLLFLAVLSFLPFGNGVFLLFRETYQRWWYMGTLMMALATASVLDNPSDYPVRKATALYMALIILFAFVMWLIARHPEKGIHIYDVPRLRQMFLMAAMGPALLLLIKMDNRKPALILAVCVFCAGTTALTLYSYQEHEDAPDRVKAEYKAGMQLETQDEQYRFKTTNNLLTMTGHTGGYGAFISTAENESYRFSRLNARYFPSDTTETFRSCPYLPELLGAKYIISEQNNEEVTKNSVRVNDYTFYITEGKACPIGFALDCWITEKELLSLPVEKRALALMNAFAVNDRDIPMIKKEEVKHISMSALEGVEPEACIQRTIQDAVMDFHRDGNGFSCKTAWDKVRFAYFTVPFDTGWKATLDGKATEILNAGGMMALLVPSGSHQIVFTYHTPGFAAGAALSGFATAGFLIYVFFLLRRKRHLCYKRIV